jgi:hypothetical protein
MAQEPKIYVLMSHWKPTKSKLQIGIYLYVPMIKLKLSLDQFQMWFQCFKFFHCSLTTHINDENVQIYVETCDVKTLLYFDIFNTYFQVRLVLLGRHCTQHMLNCTELCQYMYSAIMFHFQWKLTCWNILKIVWKSFRTCEDIAIDHNATRFIEDTISSKYYNRKPSERGLKWFWNQFL